jgi:hypothetical protein
MGTTFVSVDGEKGFWMRDSILELWLRLLALHIKDPHDLDSLAAEIRDQWLLASRGFFNGCVPHDLDEALATDEGKALVRDAIGSLLAALKKAPPSLKPDVLNLMGFEGDWSGEVETWRLLEVGKAFLDLIEGKIGAASSDATFMPGSR